MAEQKPAAREPSAGRLRLAHWPRYLLIVGATTAALSVLWVVAYRFVDPPVTGLMLIRQAEGAPPRRQDWMPLARISHHLADAVVAAEDGRFCDHGGFDWEAISAALAHNETGGRLHGGSTISQQTAKNAFLWPERSWLRKGLEVWFTVLIEAFWPKRRILEVYLNIVEWGRGVYGAEAAARAHFGKPAAALSAPEAALLAVVLPSPRRWSPAHPSPYIRARARRIAGEMAVVVRDGLAGCLATGR
ncbi:MAG: monofunctional biosynthetic peptidoglycan transglycosylase [Azospirillum sp.]|nr:monofunctional biosynthetic peptidoglycan transglycosylase [Azospirillum sp.]